MVKTISTAIATILGITVAASRGPIRDNGQGHAGYEKKYVCEALEGIKPLRAGRDTVSILCLGDLMLHTAQLESAGKMHESSGRSADAHHSYDYGCFLSEIRQDISQADLAVGNMEFALGGEPFSGYPAFSAPDSYPEYFAECGIDIFLTANNHIYDKGSKGLRRTLEVYGRMEQEYNVRYTGSGLDSLDFVRRNPLYVRVKGLKVAIVNFTYGTNSARMDGYPKVLVQNDMELITAALRKAVAEGADYIIAMPHWGTEYVYRHNDIQERTARLLAENGADIIIGTHPHVVQDYQEIVTGNRVVPVYYSIGNAVSNMSAPGTQTELMVRIDIVRSCDDKIEEASAAYDWLWCSRPGQILDSYAVVKAGGKYGESSLWKDSNGYFKMKTNLKTVAGSTGLNP